MEESYLLVCCLKLPVLCCLVHQKLADFNLKFRNSNMAEVLCYVYISQLVVFYVFTVWSPVSQVVGVHSRHFRAWLLALGIALCACLDSCFKFTLSNSANIWYDRSNFFLIIRLSMLYTRCQENYFSWGVFFIQNTAFSSLLCTVLLRNIRTRC